MVTFPEKPVRLSFSKRRKEKKKVKVKNKWYAAKVLELGQHTTAEKLRKWLTFQTLNRAVLSMRPVPADKVLGLASSENQNRWNDNRWSTPEKRASWLYERREQMSKLSFPSYSQPLCKGSFKCTGYRLLSKAVVLFFFLFFSSFFLFFLFFFSLVKLD